MGRHSAPDDYDDDDAAVLSAPPTPASRPRPGRHSGSDLRAPAPQGLDVIETVMGRDEDRDQIEDEPDTDEHTAQIQPIVDPVLDEPLPVAVTTVIPPVADGAAPRPAAPTAPQPRPAAAPRPTVDTDLTDEVPVVVAPADTDVDSDADTDADTEPAAPTGKAAAKAAKAAEKAAEKSAAKQRKAAAATRRPEPKASDLALLRADSAARARVIAAIVVPFLLYFGVLFVLDALDLRTALIWIWIPLISAGVVAGLLLDLAHRAAAVRAITDLEQRAAEADPAGR